jgi:hypothetical protein
MKRFFLGVKDEARRLFRDPVRWMGALVCPLFALLFMATVFGPGTMDRLPVGVVDHDDTALSRQIIRRAEASPSLHLVRHFTDEAEARQALQRRQVYGYLRIPYQFQQHLLNGQPTALAVISHYALLSVGSRVSTAFRTAVAGDAMPFLGVNLPQYNVNINYVVYLTYPFFFVLLQVLCLLVTIYVCGRDGLRRGPLWPAVAKLIPYTVAYALVSLVAHEVCFGLMDIPGWSVAGLLWLASVGFILATQAVGYLILRLSPDFSTAMSAGSMFGSLGATLCGVTFPLFAMDAPVRALSLLFPVRGFIHVVQTLLQSSCP